MKKIRELYYICCILFGVTGNLFAQNNELAELPNGNNSWLPITSPDEDISKCEDICSFTDNLFTDLGIADLDEEGLLDYLMNLAENRLPPYYSAFAAVPPVPHVRDAYLIQMRLESLLRRQLTPAELIEYRESIRIFYDHLCHNNSASLIIKEMIEEAGKVEKILPPSKLSLCLKRTPILGALIIAASASLVVSQAQCDGKDIGPSVELGLLDIFKNITAFDVFEECDSLIYNYFKKPKPEDPVHFISKEGRCISGQCPENLSESDYVTATGDEILKGINGLCPGIFPPSTTGKAVLPLPILNGQGESCSYQVVCCANPNCSAQVVVDNGVINVKRCQQVVANTPENTNQ